MSIDIITVHAKAVSVEAAHKDNAHSINYLDLITFQSELITLFLRPAWVSTGSSISFNVKATIKDVTPYYQVPSGHHGDCHDPSTASLPPTSWYFTYSDIPCPSYLTHTPNTTPNDTWINIEGDHTPQICSPYTPSSSNPAVTDVVPFCYKLNPVLTSPSTYEGKTITEVLGTQIADFQLNDIKPEFKATNPTLTSANDFARFIFPASDPSTFYVNYDGKFQDSHGLNNLTMDIIHEAFIPEMLLFKNIGYHFS